MELPGVFSKKPKKDGESSSFLALIVTAKTVQAGLWKLDDGQLTLKNASEIFEYGDLKQCLVRTDEALQQLGKESENATEVVFGFESGWVDDHGVVAKHKPLLKKLTEELSLKPVGFVVITEALHHYLIAAQAHLSAVVIQLFPEHLVASVINHGEMLRSESIGISKDFSSDVNEALARLVAGADDKAILPPKMLLLGTALSAEKVEDYQQKLLEQDWSKTAFFVHAPTIESATANTALNAVVQEGGRALAMERNIRLEAKQKVHTGSPETVGVAQTERAVPTATAPLQPMAKSFGIPISSKVNSDPSLDTANVVDQTESLSAASAAETLIPTQTSAAGWKQFMPWPSFNKKSKASPAVSPQSYQQFESQPKSHSSRSSKASSWLQHHMTFVWGGFGAGVLALLSIAVGAILLSKAATVKLVLTSEVVNREIALTLDPSAESSDASQLLLKARQTSKEVEDSQEVETSGVTLVGDKATGTVTLVNKTDSTKTFSAGTELSKGALIFTLNDDVEVASSSTEVSSSGETKTYGNAEANVTASQIGADSNIEAGSELAVADFGSGSYSAEIKESFSGGSSREVRVFSADDKEQLTNSLKTKLITEAQKALEEEGEDGEYVTPSGQVTVLSSEFDAEVGDEVRNVTATIKMRVGALVYTREELRPFAKELLSEEIPEGYQLSEAEPDILSSPATSSAKGVVILDANVSMLAYPKFDENDWKKEISNQKVESAVAILQGKGEVEQVEINLSPSLARFISNSIPKDFSKITFEVVLPE